MRMKNIIVIMIVLMSFNSDLKAQVRPTNEWISFYGINSLFQGAPIPVGSQINAYDPQGILCGTFSVTKTGQYGFLAVYRDDALTTNIDEGAVAGDSIRFTINGEPARLLNPGVNVWTSNGAVIEAELTTNRPPTIPRPMKDIIINEDAPPFTVTDLDSIFTDPDKDALAFTVLSNVPEIYVYINDANMLSLVLASNWHGSGQILVTASDNSKIATDTVNVLIKPINDPPVIKSPIKDVVLDENTSLQVVAGLDTVFLDIDGYSLCFNAHSDTSAILPSIQDASLFIAVARRWYGSGQILMTASDGTLVVNDTIQVEIRMVNEAPVIVKSFPDTSFLSNQLLVFNLNSYVTDREDKQEALRWSFHLVDDVKEHISVEVDTLTHMATFRALHNYSGSFTIVFTVKDKDDLAANDTLLVKVDYPTRVDQRLNEALPNEFSLNQNYPNPFNPETTIRFGLPKTANVDIVIYNLTGRQIRQLTKKTYPAGWHDLEWNGLDDLGLQVGSGIYFVRSVSGGVVRMKKVSLIR